VTSSAAMAANSFLLRVFMCPHSLDDSVTLEFPQKCLESGAN
jgi:hypothetical protein